MGATSDQEFNMIVILLFALFMFGWAFNALVGWLDERKDGYTSLLVAAGVLITLGGVAMIDWRAAVLCLICFTASGGPMILGDIGRAIRKREAAMRMMRLIATAQAEDIDRHEA